MDFLSKGMRKYKYGSVPIEKYRAIIMFGVVEHQLQLLVVLE
jgi:hypothetical protein